MNINFDIISRKESYLLIWIDIVSVKNFMLDVVLGIAVDEVEVVDLEVSVGVVSFFVEETVTIGDVRFVTVIITRGIS